MQSIHHRSLMVRPFSVVLVVVYLVLLGACAGSEEQTISEPSIPSSPENSDADTTGDSSEAERETEADDAGDSVPDADDGGDVDTSGDTDPPGDTDSDDDTAADGNADTQNGTDPASETDTSVENDTDDDTGDDTDSSDTTDQGDEIEADDGPGFNDCAFGPDVCTEDGLGTSCTTDADCPGNGVDTCILVPSYVGSVIPYCTRAGCLPGGCAGDFECCGDFPDDANIDFEGSACIPPSAILLSEFYGGTCD